jgi:hypothetical protein
MYRISHNKSDTIADFTGTVTQFNSSGGTQSVLATNLVRPSDWNADHVFLPSPEFFEPFVLAGPDTTLTAPGVGTWYLDPFYVPTGLASGQINFIGADAAGFLNGAVLSAASSGSITRYQTMQTQIAIYSAGTGANYSSMGTVFSKEVSILATWSRAIGTTTTSALTVTNALTLSFPAQWDSTGGVTYSTTAQTGTLSVGASTMVSSSMNSIISGAVAYVSGSKMIPIPFNTTLYPGQYYMAMMISSTSSSTGTNYSTGTMFSTQSVLGVAEFSQQSIKRLGLSISNTSTNMLVWHGTIATTSSSPVGTIRTSDIRNQASQNRRYWFMQQSDY